ncbi:hypothetical protein ACOMHN_044075 [Nucella lapillus]
MAEKQECPLTTSLENDEKKEDEEVQDAASDESEEDDDDSDDEDLFEVEKIISRKKQNGVFLYRVRWKGYSPSSDTWEPQENLDIVADMVREFDARQDDKAKSRQEERRIRKLRMEGKKLPGEESSSDDTDSGKEESQLCETTRFFKRLEKDKDLVWTQPDLYSKVKSRSASLTSKKEERVEESKAPTSSIDKSPPSQSESHRGRGRPRGGGTPREKGGAGRGRGRPPKKTAGGSSDKGEDGGDSSSQRKSSGRGRGRPRKKSEKGSSSETVSEDSSLESDGSGTDAKKGTGEKGESGSPAPSADEDHSEKPSNDTSEKKKDSDPEEPALVKKKPRGRPPKTAGTDSHKPKNKDKGNSEDSTPAAKSTGKSRGRPRKVTSEDNDTDPSKTKGKGRGRGRPKKKPMEGTSESGDHVSRPAGASKDKKVKKKRKDKDTPPEKSVKDSSDENEDSDEPAFPGKKSTAALSQKLTSDSEENEDVPILPVKKKKRQKQPQKNVISDSSDDSEPDGAASLAKNSPVVPERSKMSAITEHSDKNDSADDLSSARKNGKQKNQTHPIPKIEMSVQEGEESISTSEEKVISKAKKKKKKSQKKLIIEDTEDDVSDDSSAVKKTSEPPCTGEEKKTKKKKETKSKKDPKSKKEHSSSKETTAKKNSSKSGKISPLNIFSKLESTLPSVANAGEFEKKSDPAVEDSRNTAEKSKTNIPVSSPASAKASTEQSNKTTVPTPSVRSQPKAVIPVLEKFAMTSLTDSFALEADDKGSAESKAAAATKPGIKEEKAEPRSSQKKVLNNNKESKEATVSQKKNLPKGQQKSMKRKLDTAVKHTMAVKEGEASPVKAASLKPPSTPTQVSVSKKPTPVQSSFLADSHGAASSEPPSGPVENSAPSSDPSVATSASSKSQVAHTDSALKDAKPASFPTSQKLPAEAKVKSSKSKGKEASSKSHKTGPKSKSSSAKAEKQKSEKEGKSTDKNVKSATLSSVQLPSTESGVPSSVSAANIPSDAVKVTAPNKELSARSTSVGIDVQKPDASGAKTARQETSESRVSKSDAISSGIIRPPAVEKPVTTADQTDSKPLIQAEADDLKRKYSFSSDRPSSLTSDAGKHSLLRTGSASDLSATMSSGSGRQSMLRSGSSSELSTSLGSGVLGRPSLYPLTTSSPGRSTPTPSSLTSTPSKDTTSPGMFSSPGVTSRDMSSLYPYAGRDYSLLSRASSWGSSSPRDQAHTSPKDPQLSGASPKDLLSPSRDLSQTSASQASLGYSPMGYLSGMGSLGMGSLSSRAGGYSRDLFSLGSSRQDFNANIPGKDSTDKLYSPKSLYRSSSFSSTEGDRPKQSRGMDQALGEALCKVDLEYVEKLVLAPVTPMELSHDELRQAVIDGNCYLVERALGAKRYDVDLPDNKGYTLLMNAVLKGYDDLSIHLLTHGANAEVQVKGVTALMLAVEHAESCTVYMLLEMGAHVNTVDNSGETALFKAVRRGDKQILKLVLEHGADFNWISGARLTALQTAKQYCLADIDVTLTDHIHRVVETFEVEVRRVMGGAARLLSSLFPHRCVSLRDTETVTIPFQYSPTLPAKPSQGCLLFIAHARFDPEVRCRLYGQCAVRKVTVNGVNQLCITEENNFVMVFHPLITGWNELVINTQKDPMSKAKLIVCAYKTELMQ